MKIRSAVLTLPLTFQALAYPTNMEKRGSITAIEGLSGELLSPRSVGETENSPRRDSQAQTASPGKNSLD